MLHIWPEAANRRFEQFVKSRRVRCRADFVSVDDQFHRITILERLGLVPLPVAVGG